VAGPVLSQSLNDSGGGVLDKNAEKYNLTSEPDDDLQFLEEVDKEDYEGTFHDYAEAVIQFGYLNLYSVVMPYLGAISLFENLLKTRMDAYKLCR